MTIPIEEAAIDPADMTPETVDLERFYTLNELEAMPADALEELWLGCPDKTFYEDGLDQSTTKTYGEAAGDLERLDVIQRSLALYRNDPPRIPMHKAAAGEIKWFQVPGRIRGMLERGEPLEDTTYTTQEKPGLKPQMIVVIAAGVLLFMCIVFMLIRRISGGAELAEADVTSTAIAAATLTGVPAETPTPTPLALENIDRPISQGEDLRDYYPVMLEISPGNEGARVFPVQQKEVEVAEWEYEDNPDVASSVLGLVVRPVLGIPYSEANATFLEGLTAGDNIRLQMNTGQTLLFTVSQSERVDRQRTDIFDQTSPGIVIVMLADPAADRLAITGHYPAEQELGRGETIQLSTGMAANVGQPVSQGDSGVTLTILDVTTHTGPPGAELPDEWAYLLVDLRIASTTSFNTSTFLFELADSSGSRYAPVSIDGGVTNLTPFSGGMIAAGTEANSTVAFLVPRTLTTASLYTQVNAAAPLIEYKLSFSPPSLLTAQHLDIIILKVETTGTIDEPDELIVTARLFNPHSGAISVHPSDVSVIYSPNVLEDTFPIGPAVQPSGVDLPLTVQGGEALDLNFHFGWNGEPFAGIALGGYRFIATLR